MKSAVISDTHGLLRPEAIEVMTAADLILHAGDVGRPEIISALREIAPLRIVRGNVDYGPWADMLPNTDLVEVEEISIYMVHDIEDLDIVPQAAGINIVIYGHSHRPALEKKDGVIFLNPGSAGPRRMKLPICMAMMTVEGKSIHVKKIDLPG